MPTFKALGRVRVRGKMFDTQTKTLTVLCGCKEEVDPSRVPPELLSPREGERWTVVVAQPQQDNFSEKLAQFLQGEGKTMEDIATANTGGSEWNPESIIRAVGEVLKAQPWKSSRRFEGLTLMPAVWSTYKLLITHSEVQSLEKTFTCPLNLYTRNQMKDYLTPCADLRNLSVKSFGEVACKIVQLIEKGWISSLKVQLSLISCWFS